LAVGLGICLNSEKKVANPPCKSGTGHGPLICSEICGQDIRHSDCRGRHPISETPQDNFLRGAMIRQLEQGEARFASTVQCAMRSADQRWSDSFPRAIVFSNAGKLVARIARIRNQSCAALICRRPRAAASVASISRFRPIAARHSAIKNRLRTRRKRADQPAGL